MAEENLVRYKIHEVPPISELRLAQLKAMSDLPDSEIDFSDIPEMTEEELDRMKPARLKIGFYREPEPAETS